jgi:hypothetical protein
VSVPVLAEAKFRAKEALVALVGPSRFKTARWRDNLAFAALARDLDVERVMRETDDSDEMEGLYVKVEEEGQVLARYKWVRHGFLTSVVDSGTHWLARPIVPNALAPSEDGDDSLASLFR